jgi:hypothetical protein
MKRPAFQWYPSDWRKDNELQSCSIAARGLWHELLGIMHECTPYGHLTVDGRPASDAASARLCHVELREFKKLLAELEGAGVPSRTEAGILYSRRMVRDEHIRNVRAEAGKLGGNPNLINGKDNHQPEDLLEDKDKQIPTPSASSSSAVSASSKVPMEFHGDAEPVDKKPLVDKSTKGKGNPEPTKNWWKTPESIKAEGQRQGVKDRPGESNQAYKDRIFAHINHPRKAQAA